MYLILGAVTEEERNLLEELSDCRILEVTYHQPIAEVCPAQADDGTWHRKYEQHGDVQWAAVVGYVGAL